MQKVISRSQFLTRTDDTGRFIVRSERTGRSYYVEPQGDAHIEWGSVDQSTGKLSVKKGWKKNKGSTERDESLITAENGFKNIVTLKRGESPLEYIQRVDSQYESLNS